MPGHNSFTFARLFSRGMFFRAYSPYPHVISAQILLKNADQYRQYSVSGVWYLAEYGWIDLDEQFDKSILSPINSIIEPLGLPEITKRLSVVLDIFGGSLQKKIRIKTQEEIEREEDDKNEDD